MIVRTDAVVVKSMKYRETSKIVTLYTRSFGKVSVVAKGARDMKSKFGGALEPMTHVSVIFYKKPHRELHLLSHADILEEFHRLHEEYECLNVGYAVIDLLNSVMHGEEEHRAIYELLLSTLRTLDAGTKYLVNVLYYFEVRLAALLGFAMVLDRCGVCGAPIGEGISGRIGFNPIQGSLVEEQCGGNADRWIHISLQSVRILQRLSRVAIDGALNIEMSDTSRKDIDTVLRAHFGAHIEATRKLQSVATVRSSIVG